MGEITTMSSETAVLGKSDTAVVSCVTFDLCITHTKLHMGNISTLKMAKKTESADHTNFS